MIIVTMVVILKDSEKASPYVFLSYIFIFITYLTLHVITQISFFTINLLLISSSLLYLPIMISVKKFSYLPMALKSKPHVYIFWQTMIVLVFKSICFVVDAFLLSWGNDLFLIIIITITTDIIITPLIIQSSYLACNKRNMDALLASFKPCNLVRMVFNVESSSSVEPSPKQLT
ncbi:hypothetical protein CAEBREN_29342 [Caenorhabditis brenneri]|uniref:Serpentine receptor class gamma n=1 Tax=Caenorhabditis brenneri TaxID=135651 RepID=G0P2K2_CAEBE|nr:hypothetical protein CAEBREN_29342 [Caenorhabditis brenneri]